MAKKANRKNLKIAVCGSHSTGKTTLCKALAKKFKLNYIHDVVKEEAYYKKFPINEATLPETQFWILSRQLELERNTKTPWVSDKSLFDNIIYGEITFRDKKVLDVIKDIVFRNSKYDLIFYLPPLLGLEDDGIRSLDPKFQKMIDKRFKKFFEENRIRYFLLRENDFKKRLKKAEEIVKNYSYIRKD